MISFIHRTNFAIGLFMFFFAKDQHCLCMISLSMSLMFKNEYLRRTINMNKKFFYSLNGLK